MRVFVYFNLHRRLWSVKALEGADKGRVIAHRTTLGLTGCTFKVSEAGRQRVLREGRKNVHAGIVGEWHDVTSEGADRWAEVQGGRLAGEAVAFVTYNPRLGAQFVTKQDRIPVAGARMVLMDGGSVQAVGLRFAGA